MGWKSFNLQSTFIWNRPGHATFGATYVWRRRGSNTGKKNLSISAEATALPIEEKATLMTWSQ